MAAEAIQRLSGCRVNLIFPDLVGRQRIVIGNRRNRDRDLHVFFDAQLGELLRPVTLRDNNFRQNVSDIAAYQDRVQACAQAYLEQGRYELTELLSDGRESEPRHTFLPLELTLELNHGSRVRFLSSERAFYFSPCLLSHLLKSPDARSGLDGRTLEQALARMTVLEASYSRVFLPDVHTFSWDPHWERPPNTLFTPFPRPTVSVDTARLPAGCGVYLMPSGVGDAGDNRVTETAEIILTQATMPLAIYYPPANRPPQAFIRTFPNAIELNARYIPHPDCVFRPS